MLLPLIVFLIRFAVSSQAIVGQDIHANAIPPVVTPGYSCGKKTRSMWLNIESGYIMMDETFMLILPLY